MTTRQIAADFIAELCRERFTTLPRYLENEEGNCRAQYIENLSKWWAVQFFTDWTPRREKLFVAVVAAKLRAERLID